MTPADYPATFRAADGASRTAQTLHFLLILVNLGAAVLAAAAISLSGVTPEPWATRLANAATLLLVVAVLALWVVRARRDEQAWFDCRAIAESIKTSTWRFMMGAAPFADLVEGSATVAFAEELRRIREARPGVEALVAAKLIVTEPDVTAFMGATRGLSLEERKRRYLSDRVLDQRAWYQRGSARNRRMRDIYFWLVLALQVAAVGAALYRWKPGGLNVVGVIVGITASLTAWAQARRYEDLAQSYALAVQELGEIRTRIEVSDAEDRFRGSVAEGEEAISREHTMWMARRNRR